jgi:hypothetical protein
MSNELSEPTPEGRGACSIRLRSAHARSAMGRFCLSVNGRLIFGAAHPPYIVVPERVDLSQYAPRTVEVGIYGPIGPSRPAIVYACCDLAAQQLRWVNDQGEILLEPPAAQGRPVNAAEAFRPCIVRVALWRLRRVSALGSLLPLTFRTPDERGGLTVGDVADWSNQGSADQDLDQLPAPFWGSRSVVVPPRIRRRPQSFGKNCIGRT